MLGDQDISDPFQPEGTVECVLEVDKISRGYYFPVMAFLRLPSRSRRIKVVSYTAHAANHGLAFGGVYRNGLYSGGVTG